MRQRSRQSWSAREPLCGSHFVWTLKSESASGCCLGKDSQLFCFGFSFVLKTDSCGRVRAIECPIVCVCASSRVCVGKSENRKSEPGIVNIFRLSGAASSSSPSQSKSNGKTHGSCQLAATVARKKSTREEKRKFQKVNQIKLTEKVFKKNIRI